MPRSFPAPLFYYLLVQAIGVLVSFLLYEVTIVVATALLVWRPWSPLDSFSTRSIPTRSRPRAYAF